MSRNSQRETTNDVRVRPLQPATHAAVFRRGGMLRVLRRHGSHVRNAGGHESKALQVVQRRTRA